MLSSGEVVVAFVIAVVVVAVVVAVVSVVVDVVVAVAVAVAVNVAVVGAVVTECSCHGLYDCSAFLLHGNDGDQRPPQRRRGR